MKTKNILATTLCLLTGLMFNRAAHAQLYLSQEYNWKVGEYDPTTGAPINSSLITTGLVAPYALALSANSLFVADYGHQRVSEYDAFTGTLINASFISVISPKGLLVSGNSLFVASGTGSVGVYDATTGAAINANLITSGLSDPWSMALLGNSLYVSNRSPNNSAVGKYDASTGAVINATFITGIYTPFGLAVSGNNLFVAASNNAVGKYDATTGAAINAGFVTGLSNPTNLAVSGNNLFVAELDGSRVGEYDAATGAAINANFITGITPVGLAIQVPEPATAGLLGVGTLLLAARRRRI